MKLNTMLLTGLLAVGLYNVGHAQTITPNDIRAEIQAGQLTQAHVDLSNVLLVHPNSYNAYYLLAIDDGDMGNLTGAAQALKAAQAIHVPSNVDVRQLQLLQAKLDDAPAATEYTVTTTDVKVVPAEHPHNFIEWFLIALVLLVVLTGIIKLASAFIRGMERVGDPGIPPLDSQSYSSYNSYSNQPGRSSRPGGMYPNNNSYYAPQPVVVNNYNDRTENLVEDILIADIIEDEIIRDDSFDRPEVIENNTYIDNSSNNNSWTDNSGSNSWDSGSSSSDSGSNSWDSGSSFDSGSSGSDSW